ncbi:ribosomal protein L7/L12 [Paenibacillus sp. HWE-109]|uniref:ribosomal protein L7/L12 n=1 Tax=Paenibacillus sp. HWE-109 TaxID=1306526 RepID=UPI001EE051DC|nr:ribosomal protein L7/L12 [Paenibacillus sp. HWE-109]UKS29719.1 ribosomal protein L7/L12 [Paenibacillus sp. HWE-109]
MERAEIIAIISLLISIILMIKLIGQQARINELKYDIERLEGRPETYPLPKKPASAASSTSTSTASVYAKPLYALELAPELEQRLQVLLAGGKKIEAIKELRDAAGLSLKAAKDYVDAMRNR